MLWVQLQVTVSKNISRERTIFSPKNFGPDLKNIREVVSSTQPMESLDERRDVEPTQTTATTKEATATTARGTRWIVEFTGGCCQVGLETRKR